MGNDGCQKGEKTMTSEEIRKKEKEENDRALAQAKSTGKAVTFKGYDGCEVTVTPDGSIFHNAADWW